MNRAVKIEQRNGTINRNEVKSDFDLCVRKTTGVTGTKWP